jgi:hypothetical protein
MKVLKMNCHSHRLWKRTQYTLVIWDAREKPNSHAMALESVY